MQVNLNSPKRYRVEKWIWYIQIPIAVVVFFVVPDFWKQVSILYLAILSIWALGATADGNEEAAKASTALTENDNEKV